MPVERREQVTCIGIVRVNGQPEELAGSDGRRQPLIGGTSRMNREIHVRICGRLGLFRAADGKGMKHAVGTRASLRESAKIRQRRGPLHDSLKRVKLGGREACKRGIAASGRSNAQRGPWQLPPFPSLSALFRTARSGQGRAVFARRSEPLTARTVLKDGDEGKGGGVAGVSPAGFGAAPQFHRIRSP